MIPLTRAVILFVVLFTGIQTMHAQLATPDNFFVFVGEKISLVLVPPDSGEIPFDTHFKAKYKVDTSIYGNYARDTIEFDVYIHLGREPEFSKYDHVLLYLSSYNGKWYHQKYQFDAVYKTKNGRWAGIGTSDDYGHVDNKHTNLKPEKIEFQDSLRFDLSLYAGYARQQFDLPCYKTVGNYAYPVEGNYIEELFMLKRTGVLKARGLF